MGNINSKHNHNNKKKSFFPKFLIAILSLILIVAFAGFGTLYTKFNSVNKIDIDKNDLGITKEEPKPDNSNKDIIKNYDKIKNIALFGIDSVDGVGRSDAIMIATIDPIHNKFKITSLMRDSYVNINGHGKDKLNHAYAFGKAQLAMKTINQNFGLNIDSFVSVNFDSLPKIIDILGGITLDITDEELKYINNYINDINKKDGTNSPLIASAGIQQVNGVQALAYARIRYTSGGDYERTQRQRTVLDKVFEKASNIPVDEYNVLIDELLPYVQTNLTATDIISLSTKAISINNRNLEQDRFPRDGYCRGEIINGVYYLTFDEAATKEQIQKYIFEDIK